MPGSTFRADRRTAYAAMLVAFKADYNATAIGKSRLISTARVRPASLTPPMAYVGSFSEPIVTHDAGIRTRQARDVLVLVQGAFDNAETAGRMDLIADAFTDWLTANPHAVAGTVLQEVSSEDVELTIGVVTYAATLFTVTVDIGEGRD